MNSLPKYLENVANKIKTLLDSQIITLSATTTQRETYLTSATNSLTYMGMILTYITNIKDVIGKAKDATIFAQYVAQSIATETGITGDQQIVNNLLANVDDANTSFSDVSTIWTNINTINTYISQKKDEATTIFNTPIETTVPAETTSGLLANGSLCTTSSECRSNFCYLTNKTGQRCDRGDTCSKPSSGKKLLCNDKGIGSNVKTEMTGSEKICINNRCPGYRTGTNSGL